MLEISDHSIKQWTLFNGMTDEEINKVLDESVNQHYKNGEILCKQGDQSDSMFIILFGRVQIQLTKQDNQQQNLNVLSQGDHFGELSLLTGSNRTATVNAIMDTTVAVISKKRFKQLLYEIPLFSINLSNTISSWLQGELSGKPLRHKIAVVGLIRVSSNTQCFTQQITNWVCHQKGKSVEVFTDLKDEWANKTKLGYQKYLHNIPTNMGNVSNTIKELGLIEKNKKGDHVFLDITLDQNTNFEVIGELLSQCEHVWLLAEHNDQETVNELVPRLVENQKLLLKRLQCVWIQATHSTQQFSPKYTLENKFADMYCQYDQVTNKLRNQDLSKFYHKIMGVHIGLALSGGGARCISHIGVLAALEENEIYFDRIAGTSGGAIISAFYGAGFNFQTILDLFAKEMTPPKWIRFIPQASRWHLMSLFRFGLLEQRFNRPFKGYKIEQMLTPIHLICADLISGNEVIRSSGDVVECILESINHPLLGKPIFRDGLSLVDGGVLNNLPSSVLRKYNCDFVVSVDVGAKISPTFGKNDKDTPKAEMKHASYLATINRVLEMRDNRLEKSAKNNTDFMIEPNASAYPFEDFTFGKELYEIGYNTAMEVMPELKQQYHDYIEDV